MFCVTLCTFAAVVLILVLVYTMQQLKGFAGFRQDYYQDFNSNYGYPTKQLCTAPLTTPMSVPVLSGPGDATLDSPRDPYHLLGDQLKPGPERLANFTSAAAYATDNQRLIEKTGSYGQITNNYKHKMPDNGSTWLHELSISFYENKFKA